LITLPNRTPGSVPLPKPGPTGLRVPVGIPFQNAFFTVEKHDFLTSFEFWNFEATRDVFGIWAPGSFDYYRGIPPAC
jgi:hypothetical protein